MPQKESAWDRQRALLRDQITRTALELFLTQGFEATTIDQVVEAAGISRRSFFRYFGTKEDVVLGDLAARGEVIAAALAARPAGEAPWDAIRAAFAATEEMTMLDAAAGLALGRMLFATPSLRARHLEKQAHWQALFVPLIEGRLTGTSRTVRASAIVASALACLTTASEAWIESDGRSELADLYDEAVAAVRA